MATKQKKPKKNKKLECTCEIESTGQFDCNYSKGKITTKKCVCKQSPGGKELRGVGRVDLNLA